MEMDGVEKGRKPIIVAIEILTHFQISGPVFL
jgi:hypothetical protein